MSSSEAERRADDRKTRLSRAALIGIDLGDGESEGHCRRSRITRL